MAKDNNKYLVVVSVIEGRRFPKRVKHKLIAEARFDGELLSTDPVDHNESPDFTQELAWEVDRKGLHQHRLQRTSIKVQCYAASDSSGTVKEQIGYVVLDLRVAQSKQTVKWYPLLNTKYSKSKPEICLGLYLDEDKGSTDSLPVPDKNTSLKVENYRTPPVTSALRPQLDESQGLYQIGPSASCTDNFLLSVTVAFAKNLGQLIPTSMPLPSSAYFFYYSLFGNDVTNEVFHDLLHPNFPVERSSVKIRSGVDVLHKFFASQPGLQVHLCCGDQSLGHCEVPLTALVKPGSTEIYMRPVTSEDTYRLVPPNKVKQQLPPFNSETAPVVGITVVLKKEDTPVDSTPSTELLLDGSYLSISPDKKLAKDKAHVKKESKKKSVKILADKKCKDTGGYSDDFEPDIVDTEKPDVLNGSVEKAQVTHKPVVDDKPPTQPQTAALDTRTHKTTAPRPTPSLAAVATQPTHFTCSIDLRSVRDVTQNEAYNIFLRYTYPFFGSATPIVTHPPTHAAPGQEILLPQSFCAFDFACTVHQLQETFMRVPLLVELWHKDLSVGKDRLLGTSQLPLSLVFTAERTRLMNNGDTGMRQVHSDRLPILSVDRPGDSCGELTFVVSLEDWGPLDAKQLPPSDTTIQNSGHGETLGESKDGGGVTNARETAEYQAAVELELWKETQEQMFDTQMKQRETLYMKALAEEWKKRDREREMIVKKKISEYSHLEEQLRNTITDLEKREKLLYNNEQEVTRLRKDLQHEHERKLQEMREASRRLKEDCDHQVNLERSRIEDLEETIARLKNEVQAGMKKYESLEKDFAQHKDEQSNTPEVRLQSDINLLTLEKVEMNRKLDAAVKSKMHYKQQWGRALKELGRLKEREQDVARAQLKKQREELEQMRLRYLAAEEKEVAGGERRELEGIKNELNRLRALEEQKSQEAKEMEDHLKSAGGDMSNSPRNVLSHSTSDERIARLIEERDTLLRTGVYTSQDPIIAKLEKQIRECIASKS